MNLLRKSRLGFFALACSLALLACDDKGSNDKKLCGNNELDEGEACDSTKFAGGNTDCKSYDSVYVSGTLKCDASCKIDTSACKKEGQEDELKCGDGIVQNVGTHKENCDGTAFLENKTQCNQWDTKYTSGAVTCNNDCTVNYDACVLPECGDGIVQNVGDHKENCDMTTFLDDKTQCIQWDTKYASGAVTCNNDCTLNYDTCVLAKCGDGVVQEYDGTIEECDGNAFLEGVTDCKTWSDKFKSGTLTCNTDCTMNESACVPKCGDGVVQVEDNYSEECDGTAILGDITNCSDWSNKYTSGTLSCTTDCKMDVSACKSKCGDGVLQDEEHYKEECDGSIFFADETACAEWDTKYASGTVTCNNDCTLNYDTCTPKCGDGVLQDEEHYKEECDGDKFYADVNACSEWSNVYKAGTLSCTTDCKVDESTCTPKCGDGVVQTENNYEEDCDGSAFLLDETTCNGWDTQYTSGNVTCNSDCTINYDACVK
ncbi:MAG: hypothetical protein ACOX8U_00640 [Bradymonadia bacterium]|jgi:hypothetical protein